MGVLKFFSITGMSDFPIGGVVIVKEVCLIVHDFKKFVGRSALGHLGQSAHNGTG
jgi:hypothetical protein